MLQALSPVLALAANCITQILICRISKSLLKSVYVGFLAGLGVYTLRNGLSAEMLTGVITYGVLSYCYFHFINLGETARRIRILREINDAMPQGLSEKELLSKYNAKTILAVRFRRLINNSQVINRGDRYYLGKPTVLYMAQILIFMKKLLLGRTGEIL